MDAAVEPAANSLGASPSYKDADSGPASKADDASPAFDDEDTTTAETLDKGLEAMQASEDTTMAETLDKGLEAMQASEDIPAAQAAEGASNVLQETVPASNAKTIGKVKLAEGEEPPMIWLLGRGPLGDTLNFLPLALGLLAAGYRVKAVVPGMMEYVFKSYSIPCLAIDTPICFRLPRIRGFLRMKVAELTLCDEEDISKETFEDIFLDLRTQMLDANHWRATRGWEDEADNLPAVAARITESGKRFDEIWLNSAIDMDAWWRFVRSEIDPCIGHSAQCAGMERQAYIKVQVQKRKEFLAELKRRAYEACVTPLDYLESLSFSVSVQLEVMIHHHMQTGAPTHAEVLSTYQDYRSWQSNRDLRQWWEAWMKRMPLFCLNQADMTAFNIHRRALVCKKNAMHEAADAFTEDRPRLVIYQINCLPIARELHEIWGIRTLSLSHEMMPTEGHGLLFVFSGFCSMEESMDPSEQPIKKGGPVGLRQRLSSSGHRLTCTSPLLLQENSTSEEFWKDEKEREEFRQRCDGLFFLDVNMQFQATDPRLFGGQEARKEIRDFIAQDGRGEPPVCIAWGNKTDSRGPVRLASTFVAILRSARRRGVVVSRWTWMRPEVLRGMTEEDNKYWDENVLCLRSAPFEWLFPRCCCIVTYGGRSTLGAIMRSGTPAVMVVEDGAVLGPMAHGFLALGSSSFHNGKWDKVPPEEVANSINTVIRGPKTQAAAKRIKEGIVADRGMEEAVDVVTRVLEGGADDSADDFVSEPKQPPDSPPANAAETLIPWADGEYDVYEENNGSRVDFIRIQGNCGEFGHAPGKPMWFELGDFHVSRNQKDERYMVRCYFHTLSWANVTSDGLTWSFSDGIKFVHRMGYSKNCECQLL